ncbi:MAG: translation initiation factor Sui1 [Desulfocapsaceae bacterium]|nr:translation initiation factor Sui1 [Desulfocapsaceae bacterium]
MRDVKSKGLVYSTETGRMCPGCGQAIKTCCCDKQKPQHGGDGVVRISRQTKGRKGSGVCIITGLSLREAELKTLAQQLKKKCGSGGTVREGLIEIQGDHRQVLLDILLKLGYTAKLAGG